MSAPFLTLLNDRKAGSVHERKLAPEENFRCRTQNPISFSASLIMGLCHEHGLFMGL